MVVIEINIVSVYKDKNSTPVMMREVIGSRASSFMITEVIMKKV